MKNLPLFILILFTICFSRQAEAQLSSDEVKQIDSLQSIIVSANHDSTIVNAWIAWDNIIYIADTDLDMILNLRIDSLSSINLKKKLTTQEKYKFLKSKAFSLNNIGLIYQGRGDFVKAIDYLSKSLDIRKDIGDKTGIGASLNSVGTIYHNQGNYPEAIKYYQESLNIREEIGDKKGESASISNIGLIYQNQGDYAKAIEYHSKSLSINEEIGDKKGTAATLSNFGAIYRYQGNYVNSIEYYTKSLAIQEEIGDKRGIAATLGNIGLIYQDQSDFLKAIEYHNKCLKIQEQIGDKLGIAYSLNNVGLIYRNQGELSKALDYYKQSLTISEEIGDKKGTAHSLNNVGLIYQDQGDNIKAIDYYTKSLKIREEIGDKKGKALSLNNIGNTYLNQNNFEKALLYNLEALKIAQEIGAVQETKSSALSLWEINKNLGMFKESLLMHELYISIKDSIESEENQKEVVRQEYKYKYEKQATADSIVSAEAEKVHLANLEAEKALGEKQKTEIAAQKKQNIYLFVGLGLVALFGFFMFNRFKVTQKQKGIIEDQKLEVETQKVTVEKTLQELESTHEQLEESHKEITDSINYAERIQRSFLATKETLDENLKDYFVFFKPKEAVSGDFYWAAQLNNNNFAFTVADSTGHGVPGAIMSLLNITSLEKSVETETEPHNILNKTREIIVNRLSKDGSEHGGKDGMDCNLMVLNQDKSILTFASANNTIIIIRNGEILEFKGDKMPVGKHDRDTESFTLHSVQLQKGDVIYALTDGFPDQFGGPKGKKYMIKNLKNKFLQIANKSMAEQENILTEEFISWMAENEQIDDVCIIGVRI